MASARGSWIAKHHMTYWNGQDGSDQRMPSGIYIARLVTPGYSKSIKMVLLKEGGGWRSKSVSTPVPNPTHVPCESWKPDEKIIIPVGLRNQRSWVRGGVTLHCVHLNVSISSQFIIGTCLRSHRRRERVGGHTNVYN